MSSLLLLSAGDSEGNASALQDRGGVAGLARDLNSSLESGLSGDKADVDERKDAYGRNEFPTKEMDSWLDIFIESFNDPTLILLIGSAAVSLCVGVYEGRVSEATNFFEKYAGCIEGCAILTSVVLVAAITATQEHDKAMKFQELNAVAESVDVAVLRDGDVTTVNTADVVVGDIVQLEAGDLVPADGVYVSGSDVAADESSLTGEPEDINKGFEGKGRFLFSGSRLTSGCCRMLVTTVGSQSEWGRIKAGLETESSNTPLQDKLEVLAEQIGYMGMAFAGATFLAMCVGWYLLPADQRHQGLFETVLEAFIIAVTIVVVAIPEGLPLAVTISLAYSTKKMMSDNNLIRVLAACETMGNATTICSDKTGTLTQNKMTVVAGWLAGDYYEGVDALEVDRKTQKNDKLVHHLTAGISINSTASLASESVDTSATRVIGNKTEGALLTFIKNTFQSDYASIRAGGFNAAQGDRLYTFSSARKRMSVLLLGGYDGRVAANPVSFATAKTEPAGRSRGRTPSPGRKKAAAKAAAAAPAAAAVSTASNHGGAVSYTKGAAEVVLGLCSHYTAADGKAGPITASLRRELEAQIDHMAEQALRTIAVAHRTYDRIPTAAQQNDVDYIETGLCLDGLFGIKDPLRPDVTAAVAACQKAGIFVRMVTGDNVQTATAIARECGILTEGGTVLDGPTFRAMTPAQLDIVLPTLQVLARSSPMDKHTLVTRLNGTALPKTKEEWMAAHPGAKWSQRDELLPGHYEEWAAAPGREGGGQVVGVTGDGTNDGPALKAADVGLSMGLSGTDVAKAASDIVILDDNFASIVKAVKWGRSVFDNIRKFLQFQLTVNVVALTVTFVSALSGREPPLNAVMMLWVNLIMDTMGALALGTETPSDVLLDRKPYRRDASLISRPMIRNIAVQSVYQIGLLMYLLFHGAADFGLVSGSKEHTSVIFTTFVVCQLFNEVNARSITDDCNIFKGIFDNVFFIGVVLATAMVQWALIESPSVNWLLRTVSLPDGAWYKCIVLGSISLPLGGLMRLLPIAENSEDLAVPNELLEGRNSADEKGSKAAAAESARTSTSYAAWLTCCALVTVVVGSEFGALWAGHLQAAGGAAALFAPLASTSAAVCSPLAAALRLK